MDKKTLMRIIPIAATVIFFIWGWIDTFQHSWIIYVIAGGAMAVLSGMDKNRKTEEAETVPAKQEEDE